MSERNQTRRHVRRRARSVRCGTSAFGVRSLFLAALLSGCSYSTHYVLPNRGVYPPGDPGMVAVTSMQRIPQPHKILGPVAVSVWGDGEQARSALQREAAMIGANLVVDFQIHRSTGGTSASGLAVLLHQE